MKNRSVEKMNYKIKIAGIITLVSIFLLAVTACEDAGVGATTYSYICVNGEADTGRTTTENEQRCVSCNTEFTFDSVNAICTGGFTCLNGTPVSGLSPTGEQQCDMCNAGYTLDNANAACSQEFTCLNGTPVSGLSPTGGERCERCNAGYALDDTTSTCFSAFVCLNGTPTSGLSPIPGAFSCQGCNDGYTLAPDNSCVSTIQFICPNGIPVDDPAPAPGMINCQSCASTYALVGSACATAIRLVGGSSELEGRVEIFHDDQWGTVCDDLWDNTDAAVVCQELGFSAIGAVGTQRAAFGQGSGQIWLDNVQCAGTESRLIDCPSNGLGIHNCAHSEDASVVCQP